MHTLLAVLFSLAAYFLVLFVLYRLYTGERKLDKINLISILGLAVTASGALVATHVLW